MDFIVAKAETGSYGSVTGTARAVRRVVDCLDAAGVEFTNGDQPGVKLR